MRVTLEKGRRTLTIDFLRRLISLLACVAVALAVNQADAQYGSALTLRPGVISHWSMSETSGNTVADLVTNDSIDGNNLGSFTLGGGASLGVPGPRPADGFLGLPANNTAINFSGTTGQRLSMNAAGYTGSGGLTSISMASWFRLTAPATANQHNHLGGLQLEADGASNRYGFVLSSYPQSSASSSSGSSRGGLRLTSRSGNAPDDVVEYSTDFTSLSGDASFWDSNWHYAVGTLGPFGSNSRIAKLYVDGAVVKRTITPATAGQTVGPAERLTTRDALAFGLDAGASSRRWVGQLDDIAMFNRELTGAEIGIAYLAAKGITSTPSLVPTQGLSAHRGLSSIYPENTLSALKAAVEAGAQQIEFDVQLTSDGQLVLMHDSTIDRTTDGTGRVRDYTLAQLKALDAGSWKGTAFTGEKIPTLQEALAILPLNTQLNVDAKPVGGNNYDTGFAIAQALQEARRLHQASVTASSSTTAAGARAAVPAVKLDNLNREGGNTPLFVANTISNGYKVIQLDSDYTLPTPTEIQSLQNNGIQVNYYYSDNPNNVPSLYQSGVEFILTNDVESMMAAAIKQNVVPLLGIYRGDFNTDGTVDWQDVPQFMSEISNPAAYESSHPSFDVDVYGDFNLSGMFGVEDYAGFRSIVTNGTAPLPGDYNLDGVVDMADLSTWRNLFGLSGSSLVPADGNGNGIVDAADYVVWRKAISQGSGSNLTAEQQNIPEPASLHLAAAAVFVRLTVFGRGRHGLFKRQRLFSRIMGHCSMGR